MCRFSENVLLLDFVTLSSDLYPRGMCYHQQFFSYRLEHKQGASLIRNTYKRRVDNRHL